MRLRSTYKVGAILLLYVILQARINGPGFAEGLRVTGAPGDGTCANPNCHISGAFEPSLSIVLKDGTDTVFKYEPGKTYTMRVHNTPGSGTPSRFGFQAVALNSANAQAGNWGTPGVGKRVVTLSGRKYVEHSSPSATGIFQVPWVAPLAGTGTVTFYSASIAANNNGSTSGDGMAKDSLVIEEFNVSGISNRHEPIASLQVSPNPADEYLNVKIASSIKGDYKFRVLSTAGIVVKEAPVNLNVGLNEKNLSLSELAPGLYILQLCGHGHLGATQILKK